MTVSNPSVSGGFMHTNPMIARLSRVTEADSESCCSYRGIARKLSFFLAMVAAGILACGLLKLTGALGGETAVLDPDSGVSVTAPEVLLVLACGALFLITPFLAVLIRVTAPVTGSLYCFATGYLLSWAAATFGRELSGPIWLALVLTIALVLTMGMLYGSGKVKVDQKFRTVLTTLFIAAVAGGVLVSIAALIPATRPFVALLRENAAFSVLSGVLTVLIGTLFLLVDFDAVKQSVDRQLPKKYEWSAAFGLAFSVIWLYFKILELILRFSNRGRK